LLTKLNLVTVTAFVGVMCCYRQIGKLTGIGKLQCRFDDQKWQMLCRLMLAAFMKNGDS